jgi:membrane fusion protein (multidrug efflux system)
MATTMGYTAADREFLLAAGQTCTDCAGAIDDDTVLVVGADNKPAPRPVTVAGSQGPDWVITAGLAAGDRVIVDGVPKMMPGAPVNPVPWSPPGQPGKPGAAPAGASAPAAAAPASAASAAPMAASR